MPHLIANRPRLLALVAEEDDLRTQFLWESVNAIVYSLGGAIFVVGSILFFPQFGSFADLGAWLFFAGSLLYLVVSVHDLLEVVRYRNSDGERCTDVGLEILSVASYLLGTVLFAVGSLLFLSAFSHVVEGAWMFIVGSGLFAVGACVNVLQIVQARTMQTLQLQNLTAISFIVGAVLFIVASSPYLWAEAQASGPDMLHSFVAWQYLAGSGLFLLGGIFNYRRAWAVVRQGMTRQQKGAAQG